MKRARHALASTHPRARGPSASRRTAASLLSDEHSGCAHARGHPSAPGEAENAQRAIVPRRRPAPPRHSNARKRRRAKTRAETCACARLLQTAADSSLASTLHTLGEHARSSEHRECDEGHAAAACVEATAHELPVLRLRDHRQPAERPRARAKRHVQPHRSCVHGCPFLLDLAEAIARWKLSILASFCLRASCLLTFSTPMSDGLPPRFLFSGRASAALKIFADLPMMADKRRHAAPMLSTKEKRPALRRAAAR